MKYLIAPPNRLCAWINAAIFLSIIYATLGIVRPVVNFLRTTGSLNTVVYGMLLLFIVFLVRLLITFKVKGFIRYILLMLLIGIYGLSLKYLVVAPEERIHFIEYGLLYLLICIALSFTIKKTWVLSITAFFSASAAGYIDELIQHILPSRVYDIRDVGLNMLSALLMFIFMLICSGFKYLNRNQSPH